MTFGISNETTGKLAHICVLSIELSLILHHTAVGRHIGEEHEGQTALEETSTTTELQSLVAKNVVCKTDTRRKNNLCCRPLTSINTLTIIIEILNGIVCHKVAIVEDKCVETDTSCKFQTFSGVPFILQVDTKLAILHLGSRIGLTIITVCKTNHLRSFTIDEIINTVVAIITSTVTHIGVISHLVLKSDTSHKLVVAHIVCHVILHIPYSIVNCIVVCEELITESHIVVDVARTVENINEWELR